jgi:hypothetical protein
MSKLLKPHVKHAYNFSKKSKNIPHMYHVRDIHSRYFLTPTIDSYNFKQFL